MIQELPFWSVLKGIILFTGSPIEWNPHNTGDSLQLERVQRQFLRLVTCCRSHVSHMFIPLSDLLNLISLVKRRRIAGINYIKGLLSNKLDSSVLTSLCRFKVPQCESRPAFPSLFLIILHVQ